MTKNRDLKRMKHQPTEASVETTTAESSPSTPTPNRLRTVLYYAIPFAVMLAVTAYTVGGILRFQRALAQRPAPFDRRAVDGGFRYFPERLLEPNGQWSFAGVDWNCSRLVLNEAELHERWNEQPPTDNVPSGPSTETERRFLETLHSAAFSKTDLGNTRYYSLESGGFLFRTVTVLVPESTFMPEDGPKDGPEDDKAAVQELVVKERFLSGELAIAVATDHWELLHLTLPKSKNTDSAATTLLPMPSWAVPLCSRLDENQRHVFEIFSVADSVADSVANTVTNTGRPASLDEIRRELENAWQQGGWTNIRTPGNIPSSQWSRNEKLVSVRLTGDRPEDVKIMLIDGTASFSRP